MLRQGAMKPSALLRMHTLRSRYLLGRSQRVSEGQLAPRERSPLITQEKAHLMTPHPVLLAARPTSTALSARLASRHALGFISGKSATPPVTVSMATLVTCACANGRGVGVPWSGTLLKAQTTARRKRQTHDVERQLAGDHAATASVNGTSARAHLPPACPPKPARSLPGCRRGRSRRPPMSGSWAQRPPP